nr:MAG TPA: hypothetical protein [Bacteriophage sp.]
MRQRDSLHTSRRARFACRAPRSLVHTSQAQDELSIFLSKSQYQ